MPPEIWPTESMFLVLWNLEVLARCISAWSRRGQILVKVILTRNLIFFSSSYNEHICTLRCARWIRKFPEPHILCSLKHRSFRNMHILCLKNALSFGKFKPKNFRIETNLVLKTFDIFSKKQTFFGPKMHVLENCQFPRTLWACQPHMKSVCYPK